MPHPFRTWLALGVFLVPAGASAQGTSGAITVAASDGGDNRLQLGALVQFDGRFAVDDSQGNVTSTFLARRVRPILQGCVAKHVDFYLNLDFAGGNVNVRDAYVDTRFSDAFRVRAGKGKVPMGLERLHGAASLLFVERAMPTTVAPDRDWQVQVLGDLAGGRLNYTGSIGNDAKDVAGRLVVRPWAGSPARRLSGVRVGLAATTGPQPSLLPSFRTDGQQMYFSYGADAAGVGRRTRVSPQAFYYCGPFGAFGELVSSRGHVRRGLVEDDVEHRAWQVAGSWVLTGETASDRGVRPRANFDPSRHTWGAFQVAARYHQATIGSAAIALRLAAESASPRARAWIAGVNWYLNPFIKWVFNVERTVFDASAAGPRAPENLLVFRGQVSF